MLELYLIIWFAFPGGELQARMTDTPLRADVCYLEGARQRHLKRDKGAVRFGAACLSKADAEAWTLATRGDYASFVVWPQSTDAARLSAQRTD